jgi:transposase
MKQREAALAAAVDDWLTAPKPRRTACMVATSAATSCRPGFSGAVYAFRGRRGGLIKVLWHDGVGMCLFIERLERGQFVWPMSASGTVALTAGAAFHPA